VKCSLTNSARLHFIDLGLREVRAPWVLFLQVGVAREIAVLRLCMARGALQIARQAFPRRVLVGEQRVAAGGRQFLRMQHRAEARPVLVRQVGMPEVAGVAQADGLAVLADVRHDEHLGLRRQLELAQHVDLQRAPAAAERDLLRRRDVLVAEHEDVVRQVGAVQAREVVGVEREGEVEAHDLGAERRVERNDVEALAGLQYGGHGMDRVGCRWPKLRVPCGL
jgi:hypothetical protein